MWLTTPTNTTAGVRIFCGVMLSSFFSSTCTKPLPSAIPMPSVATMVMPSGGKLMKFFTIRVTKVVSSSGESMLTTWITSPVSGWR